MCGRFTLTREPEEIFRSLGVRPPKGFRPGYNIAPGRDVLAVIWVSGGPGPEAAPLRWGLVPSWSRDPAAGYRMINAKAETAAVKPAFRAAMKYRRCLVPADGFYEWQPSREGKQPYLIYMKDRRAFALAGLWEIWHGPGDEIILSCAVLTCPANDLVGKYHQRMPVIIKPGDYQRWLDQKSRDATGLLLPYPSSEMAAHPVSKAVNNPENQGQDLVEPV